MYQGDFELTGVAWEKGISTRFFQMIFLNVNTSVLDWPPGFVFLLASRPSQDHLSRGELPGLLGVSEAQVLARRSGSDRAR